MYINNDVKPTYPFTPQKTSAIAFMKAQKGKIMHIHYPDVSKDPEIKKINILKKVADIVTTPENCTNREGLIHLNWPELPTSKTHNHIRKFTELKSKLLDCSDVHNDLLFNNYGTISIYLSRFNRYYIVVTRKS